MGDDQPVPSLAEVHAALTAPGQPFEIEVVDIRGVPTRTWKNAPPTLRALLENSATFGDREFLVYEQERWTYAAHAAAAATLAAALVDLGVTKGDRVAIAMRNYPEWSLAFWAAAAAGAVVVPLNAWWTGPELAYGVNDSGAKVLIADEERWHRLFDSGELADPSIPVLVAKAAGRDLAGHARHLAEVLDGPARPLPDVDLRPDDDATIFYTSGTTSFPKGVLGTHRNICTNLVSLGFAVARTMMRSPGLAAQPPLDGPATALVSVPFFHATGCHSLLVASLAAGNRLVVMYKWDPGEALRLIERERINIVGGVPAMVWQLIQHPDFATTDISSLRTVSYGGAPAAPELVREIERLFPGRTPGNGYGLTETSSVTTMNQGADYIARPDSVGVPVAVCEVRVTDDLDNVLPQGSVGELWIKGPNVLKEYWNKPEATAEAIVDGWFRSGDVARVDGEGFVYLLDRAKDLIIRGGENIASAEVEAALFEHPDVFDAAVFGVPHQTLGEELGAVIVRRAGSDLDEEGVRRHVAERLAQFKVPAHVWFTDVELPRNPAGKVLKRDLKDQYGSQPG